MNGVLGLIQGRFRVDPHKKYRGCVFPNWGSISWVSVQQEPYSFGIRIRAPDFGRMPFMSVSQYCGQKGKDGHRIL